MSSFIFLNDNYNSKVQLYFLKKKNAWYTVLYIKIFLLYIHYAIHTSQLVWLKPASFEAYLSRIG